MTLKKIIGSNAVFRLEKDEEFEKGYKYMIILNYDLLKDYSSLDGDIYKKTYTEALCSALAWGMC